MGNNITLLIKEFREGDTDKFVALVDKFSPLIKKYVRLLYRNEREDSEQELALALLEAVLKMKYYDNEGQCVLFLLNAIKHRYYELCRESAKRFDYETNMDTETLEKIPHHKKEYDTVIFIQDINMLLGDIKGKRRKIFYAILINGDTDSEIAKNYWVSRQYANRMRRESYEMLKEGYINNSPKPHITESSLNIIGERRDLKS